MSVNHLSPSAFAVLRHRNWTGLSLAELIETGRVPLIVRELGSPHPEAIDAAADAALGEVALVEDIPARREVVREVQDAAKAIVEGERVLRDGVELFTAIMLADHNENHDLLDAIDHLKAQLRTLAPQKPSA